ncbi:hypothetical protein EVAR_37027_1 [Eumeta japonica]|uniref:Uncharacterized protein n=1 Tax=Eumeta variegata TaxID=151549 RepID=A0A4C1WII6_EUMVA|nr:hypothetical protein EVAR_37027_1 [Eumeta japonica]
MRTARAQPRVASLVKRIIQSVRERARLALDARRAIAATLSGTSYLLGVECSHQSKQFISPNRAGGRRAYDICLMNERAAADPPPYKNH